MSQKSLRTLYEAFDKARLEHFHHSTREDLDISMAVLLCAVSDYFKTVKHTHEYEDPPIGGGRGEGYRAQFCKYCDHERIVPERETAR